MEALVVGAGPVGLIMAIELVRRGVKVRVIDKSLAPSSLSKALAVHARTMEIFEQIGVVEAFLQRGFRVEGMSAHMGDTGKMADVIFSALDSPYPFILDIPQSDTEAILIEHLSELGVQVERGVELTELKQSLDLVEVQLQDRHGSRTTRQVQWVIGCDGAHSTVRHQLGVPFEGTMYPDTFLLGDVRVEWTLPEDRIHVFLSEEGLLAAFPYGKQRYRVMANALNESDVAAEPDLQRLQQLVESRSSVPAQISEPTWLNWFHSHLRHAKQTRVKRAFLVGDAAHVHSPAGGQGMNTGIQDAYNLAWKLALVISGKATERLLESYPEERLAVAESVLKLSDGLFRTATSNSRMIKLLRNHLAPVLLNTNLLHHRMTEQISEVAVHYRNSSLVQAYWQNRALFAGRSLQPGDRAPDVQYADERGVQKRFYQLLHGTRFTVFVFSGRLEILDELEQHLDAWHCREEFILHCVCSKETSQHLPGYHAVIDPSQAIANRYNLSEGSMMILRPDGYIGYLSDTVDVSHVREFAWRVLNLIR